MLLFPVMNIIYLCYVRWSNWPFLNPWDNLKKKIMYLLLCPTYWFLLIVYADCANKKCEIWILCPTDNLKRYELTAKLL